MVHGVSECDPCVRICKAERSPGAEVSEAALVRSERPTFGRGLESVSEVDLIREEGAELARLALRRYPQQLGLDQPIGDQGVVDPGDTRSSCVAARRADLS